jgi:hypothetical protein
MDESAWIYKNNDFKGIALKSLIKIEKLNRKKIYKFSVTEKCVGCGFALRLAHMRRYALIRSKKLA